MKYATSLQLIASCFLSMLAMPLDAQHLSALQAVRPDGVLRTSLQPSAILLPEDKMDWAFMGVEMHWHGNILLHHLPVQFHYNTRPVLSHYSAIVQNAIQGPALSFPLSSRAALAINLSYQQHLNAHATKSLGEDITTRFSEENYYGLTRSAQYMRVNEMQWYQLDLTYARVLTQHRNSSWRGGVNLKLLGGTSAFQLNVPYLSYKLLSSNAIHVYDYRLQAHYSAQFEQPDNLTWAWKPQGVGVGLDIGISWRRKETFRNTKNQWSLQQTGMSLLNLGGITYRQGAKTFWGSGQQKSVRFNPDKVFDNIKTPASLQESLGNYLTIASENKALSMRLPITWRTEAFFARNAWGIYTALQLNLVRWQISENHLHTPSQIMLTTSHSWKHWQIALPLRWGIHTGPGYGLVVSRDNFSFGVDHVGFLLGLGEGSRLPGFFLVWHRSFFKTTLIDCPKIN